MGNKLVLLGGGGHCKSVLDAALRMRAFEEIVITDPDIKPGTKILGCNIIGSDDELERLYSHGFNYAFITVGSIISTSLRRRLVEKANKIGFSFTTIIDPSAIISDLADIASGTFVGKNAVINADVKIGFHAIINTGAIIEHECIIGNFSHISVGSILCGEVEVGEDSMIGAGSTIVQCIHIGNNVILGANSTVLTDVEDNMKCYGIVKRQTVCVGGGGRV